MEQFVVVALFIFDNEFPIFNELIGVYGSSMDAFNAIDQFNYEKVIAGSFEDVVSEEYDPFSNVLRKKEISVKDKNKFEYIETRNYKYVFDEDEGKPGRVKVVISMFKN